MATQSLKNLDSFSRGYIEKVTSKVDFGTTLRGTMNATPITDGLQFTLTDAAEPVNNQAGSGGTSTFQFEDASVISGVKIGQVVAGIGIKGIPRVTAISADEKTITIDLPQTLAAGTILTFSDTNAGLEQYSLTGSTKRRSKEDIRIEDLVPSELLEYATSQAYGDNETGGIRSFIESYYQFLNLEEFLYKDEVTLEDIVIDGTATFRILDPDLKNNQFFVKGLVESAKFFDENDLPLIVGDETLAARPSGTNITLNDTAVLTIGRSYIITDLGSESAANVKTDLDLLIEEDLRQESYAVNDIFVAINDGTALANANDIIVQEIIEPLAEVDIRRSNIRITNGNNLPGQLANAVDTGKTVIISELPARLNKKKLKMTTFLQYYVNSNPSYRLNTLEDSLNINENDEEFLDMMQKEIAPSISKSTNVNKRALYQRLIDFYRVRGSKDSVETFFKLFFGDEEIEVKYPWDNTLKPSEGNFDSQSLQAADFSISATVTGTGADTNGDIFGWSVDVDGNTMITGAPNEDTGGANRGKAFVYVTANDGVTWTEQKVFQSSSPANDDLFGRINRIEGDTAVIAAPGGGYVEVWERFVNSSGNLDWAFNTRLQKPDGVGTAHYGRQVELHNGYLAVGAAAVTNANTVDGALYIYKQVGSTWNLNQTIQADVSLFTVNPDGSKCQDGRGFGASYAGPRHIAMLNEYLVLGFPNYGDTATNSGIAIIYKRDTAGQYQQEAVIRPSFGEKANARFGQSVDISIDSSDQLIVAIGNMNGASIAARVHIYGRSIENGAAAWNEITVITAPTNRPNRFTHLFAASLALKDDNLIVGDPGLTRTTDRSGNTIVGQIGLVHQYERSQGIWKTEPDVTTESPNSVGNDYFGWSLAISKDTNNYIIAGRPMRNSTVATDAGKVHVFNRPVQPGKYLDSKGHLSDNQKLHDSDRFQKFSYVVRAPRNVAQWEDVYSKLVHPAGFKFFGEILIITKLVRDFLGDNNREVTVSGYTDPLIAYASSPAFRKTLSSMPGVQPGYIGVEDVGLLIEALGSLFGPLGIAKTNKNAKLDITSVGSSGEITGISIAERGSGYASAPTIAISGGGSSGTATCTINSRGEVNSVTITNAGTGYSIESAATIQTLAQVSSSGTVSQIGKDSSTTLGLFFASFGNRKFRTLPTIVISEPDARDAIGTALATNVQATATFTHSSISAGSFVIGTEYKITSAGNTDWLAIGAPNKNVGTIFRATGAGSGSGTATDFKITGFTVTEAGNGYLNDPELTIESNPTKEKRVPQYEHKKIIPSNVIDNSITSVVSLHQTRAQVANNYYNRKDYGQTSFMNGIKKFGGNYNIREFSNITIEEMNGTTNEGTNINKNNIQTTIFTDSV